MYSIFSCICSSESQQGCVTLFPKQNKHKCFCISEPVPANELDLFQWLPIEHMCILVYLVWKIMLYNSIYQVMLKVHFMSRWKKIQIFIILNSFFMLKLSHDKRKWILGKKPKFWFLWQVTVMHSMQAGHMDKAQKYTDKALMQIEKLKSKPALFF